MDDAPLLLDPHGDAAGATDTAAPTTRLLAGTADRHPDGSAPVVRLTRSKIRLRTATLFWTPVFVGIAFCMGLLLIPLPAPIDDAAVTEVPLTPGFIGFRAYYAVGAAGVCLLVFALALPGLSALIISTTIAVGTAGVAVNWVYLARSSPEARANVWALTGSPVIITGLLVLLYACWAQTLVRRRRTPAFQALVHGAGSGWGAPDVTSHHGRGAAHETAVLSAGGRVHKRSYYGPFRADTAPWRLLRLGATAFVILFSSFAACAVIASYFWAASPAAERGDKGAQSTQFWLVVLLGAATQVGQSSISAIGRLVDEARGRGSAVTRLFSVTDSSSASVNTGELEAEAESVPRGEAGTRGGFGGSGALKASLLLGVHHDDEVLTAARRRPPSTAGDSASVQHRGPLSRSHHEHFDWDAGGMEGVSYEIFAEIHVQAFANTFLRGLVSSNEPLTVFVLVQALYLLETLVLYPVRMTRWGYGVVQRSNACMLAVATRVARVLWCDSESEVVARLEAALLQARSRVDLLAAQAQSLTSRQSSTAGGTTRIALDVEHINVDITTGYRQFVRRLCVRFGCRLLTYTGVTIAWPLAATLLRFGYNSANFPFFSTMEHAQCECHVTAVVAASGCEW